MSGRVVIETQRLALREFVPEDLDALAALLADPAVMRFWPRPYTRSEAQERLERYIEDYPRQGYGLWVVELRETGWFVGRCGLLNQTVDGRPELEIGYMLASSHWRQGLGTEAARGIRDWAFTHLPVDRLIALIMPENVGSIGVAVNAGMARVGTHVHFGDPHAVYAIRREDWLRQAR